MTREEKELLLKNLCARLPYGVIGKYSWKGNEPHNRELTGNLYDELNSSWSSTEDSKFIPYLRSMSSMTEEECDKVEEILGNDCIFDFMGNGDIVLHKGNFTQKTLYKLYDFYNSIHVDYHTDDKGRTMIERGLAIEVTEENNPYKE